MDDLRIYFVGDSYMDGSNDIELLSWVQRLYRGRYNFKRRFTFYELGIRSDTSADIKARWKTECRARLPDGSDNRAVLHLV